MEFYLLKKANRSHNARKDQQLGTARLVSISSFLKVFWETINKGCDGSRRQDRETQDFSRFSQQTLSDLEQGPDVDAQQDVMNDTADVRFFVFVFNH